jgi:hypothetical protein
MTQFHVLRIKMAYVITIISAFFLANHSFAQSPQAGPLRPNFGSASTYAVFTGGGAINNTGMTQLTGDVGQDGAYAFNGFPPGTYTGTLNRNNGATALAKSDLLTAWTIEAAVPCDIVLGVGIVDGQSFNSAVYCSGAATTTSGNITFDAKGDGNAIFIVKIGGQLDANAGTHILLANSAVATNIYWFVDGAVNIADNSTFKGVIFARGAIEFHGTSTLEGRALTAPAGAITLASTIISPFFGTGPGNKITVLKPAQGDSLMSGAKNYQITWSGTGINSQKIFEYSLNNGLTWVMIDTITADVFNHNWSVPDTQATGVLLRITDGNKLVGTSGAFTISRIKSTRDTIIILTPSAGEKIVGGTKNYLITWTGTGIGPMLTFSLSLDDGLTWNMVGTSSENVYYWNVPDTASIVARIRIADNKGLTGVSDAFIITKSKPNTGTITIVNPASGETIAGGTMSYQINFTAVGTTPQKTLEYSLDEGANWNLIGFMNSDAQNFLWADVPNQATTQALVRITDALGATGTSGLFTITVTAGVGSINSLTLTGLDANNNIGNAKTLGISWSFTPDIGTSVKVEISLDGMNTWIKVADNNISNPQTSWTTKNTGYYNPIFVRLTSTKGMTRISAPFSIGSNASVTYGNSAHGYSVTNYPNPAAGSTNFNIILPIAGDVTLHVIEGLGKEMSTIVSRHLEAGTYSIPFNTLKLDAGIYQYILEAGQIRLVGKMVIIK